MDIFSDVCPTLLIQSGMLSGAPAIEHSQLVRFVLKIHGGHIVCSWVTMTANVHAFS